MTVSGTSANVVLTVGPGGARITLDHMMSRPDFGVQQVQFADGTIWTEQQVKALAAVNCFARGTAIATNRGEIAVESLKEGDSLITYLDGASRPIKWIGHRHVNCQAHPDPRTVWPVRVRASAFGDRTPCRDLWLSPDHAVFVDGVLIPIRRLINGTSIVQVEMAEVTYFHIELDRHDVLFAEGLPAESYLDTGNRTAFANDGTPTMLHPEFADRDPKTRTADGCAPLVVEAGQVEPVWRRLAERAAAIGFGVASADAVTNEADLRLSVGGRMLRPVTADGGRCMFAVPRMAGGARLNSRAGAPSDIRPWLDDRRRLGVSVERIIFHGGGDRTEFPLDHPELASGWHGPEKDGLQLWRWTDGDAILPMPLGTTMVEIHLAGTAEYLLAADADREAAWLEKVPA